MGRRIGIVGYGSLGQFLAQRVLESPALDLAFVWNRTALAVVDDPAVSKYHLPDLSEAASRRCDLIVEVAHPKVLKEHGVALLQAADLLVGSPTAFADAELEAALRKQAAEGSHGLYVGAGAFWGAGDITKMDARGTLKALKVTMAKHPSSLKVGAELQAKVDEAKESETAVTVYSGAVRALCPLAPNNVNTMACAAISAPSLGFDGVQCALIADRSLEAHVITIDVTGPTNKDTGEEFSVKTVRSNPAAVGAVTGQATYVSFHSSLLRAHGQGNGVHLC